MNWRKNLWSLWVGCLISSSCYTMLLPFLPLYLLDLGAAQDSISIWSGLVFAITFCVSAVMSPYWGRRADRSGRKNMLLRAGFSLATAYLLGAFVTSPLQLLFVRFLQGFATGFVPAALSLVSASVPGEKMGFSLGLMQTASLIGTIIGPVFGGTLSHVFGIRVSFIVAAITMFLGTFAVKSLVIEPKRIELPQACGIFDDFKVVLKNKILLEVLLLVVAIQTGIMALQPLITLYVTELQGSAEGAVLTSGMVFGLIGIAGAIAAPLWGKVGQRAGFKLILISAFWGAGLLDCLVFLAAGIWSFSGLEFVYGIFIAGVLPALNTIAAVNTEPQFRGRIFGLMTSANQLGSMIGPLIGGVLAVGAGLKETFVYTGIFLIAVAILLCKQSFLRALK